MKKIGFIGLGIMGGPMSRNLLKKGAELLVYDANLELTALLVRSGAKEASPDEIGRVCDIIFTMLPNGDIVKEVLFGKNGVAASISPGKIVADCSSVQPGESRYCFDRLAEVGVGFLDAPVSGGEPKAIDGTLAFMVGGAQKDFDVVKPYLEMMGTSVVLVGENGAGSVTKLCNQIIVNLGIAAISEGFVLAAKAGVDPSRVYEAIRGGLAGSTVMDAKVPMMIRRNFTPGGRISVNHKDIKNAVAAAHELDVPLLLTSQLLEIMQSIKVMGGFEMDHSGIVQFYERLAGTEVASK